MKRVALDDLVLQILLLDLGDPAVFLSRAVDPPSSQAIANSLELLEGLQAIERVAPALEDGAAAEVAAGAGELEMEESGAQLTALGYHLAQLPISPRIGKVLLFGAVFQCVEPALTVAASLSTRSPFMSPFDKREEADMARRQLGGYTESDHLTLLAAYEEWTQIRRQGAKVEWAFLNDNFLSRNTLLMIDDLRHQFRSLLGDIGFLSSREVAAGGGGFGGRNRRGRRGGPVSAAAAEGGEEDSYTSGAKGAVMRAILCGGFFPNVAIAPRSVVKDGGGDEGKGAGSKGGQKVGEASLTSMHGSASLHPCTVNFEAKSLSSRFLIYNEVVKTSKVYIRDSTSVPPEVLLLFGGRLVVHHESEIISVGWGVKRWIHFKAPRRVGTVVKLLRQETEALLLRKITHPDEDLPELGRRLIEAVSRLLGDTALASNATAPAPGSPGDKMTNGSKGGKGNAVAGKIVVPADLRPGDWLCGNCGAHNFARNTTCFKCSAPASAAIPSGGQQGNHGNKFGNSGGQQFPSQPPGNKFGNSGGQQFPSQPPGNNFLNSGGQQFLSQPPGNNFLNSGGQQYPLQPHGNKSGYAMSYAPPPPPAANAPPPPPPPPAPSPLPPPGLYPAQPKQQVAQIGGNSFWTCTVCTLHNQAAASHCAACGSPKPSVQAFPPQPSAEAQPAPQAPHQGQGQNRQQGQGHGRGGRGRGRGGNQKQRRSNR